MSRKTKKNKRRNMGEHENTSKDYKFITRWSIVRSEHFFFLVVRQYSHILIKIIPKVYCIKNQILIISELIIKFHNHTDLICDVSLDITLLSMFVQ